MLRVALPAGLAVLVGSAVILVWNRRLQKQVDRRREAEQALAARRAGVQTIILPAENRQDVEEDLTPELIEGVTIHYASHIEDVLAVALPLLKARPDTKPAAKPELVVGSVA